MSFAAADHKLKRKTCLMTCRLLSRGNWLKPLSDMGDYLNQVAMNVTVTTKVDEPEQSSNLN